MKIKYINKRFIPALAIVMGLSSCLKDKNPQLDFSKLKPVVEISVPLTTDTGVPSPDNSGDGAANTFSFAFVASTSAIPYQIPVNYAYSKPSPGITATMAIDPKILDDYNDIEGTDLEVLPAQNYTISDLKVNIASGTQVAYLPINFVNTLALDATKSYALPIKIASAPGAEISGNYGSVIVLITIKNKYDGNYLGSGSIAFPPPTAGRSWTNLKKALKTIDANTVKADAADLGSSKFYMRLTVNADNSVTVTADPTSANTTIQNNPTNGASTYNPTTKTFTLHYKYVGASGDRVIDEVIKPAN
ncbi:DUF1735 domain-containing protein [Mucilaginibacter sp. SMC90]|uniref:BT_3987 domain-containing protein n=1 Tax=Mucilaginibacter sp. SMC90 TaxID=2929803 RepID=UPI001FB391D3|nr:DUF1735 domain-containing protein [Mucilaginibacter sp. SMC90]UOE49674.1 DUF1735 domain-containing protein [Mucilaginibacter sp. SMC90]